MQSRSTPAAIRAAARALRVQADALDEAARDLARRDDAARRRLKRSMILRKIPGVVRAAIATYGDKDGILMAADALCIPSDHVDYWWQKAVAAENLRIREKRNFEIAKRLANGKTASKLARRYRLTKGRISQIKSAEFSASA